MGPARAERPRSRRGLWHFAAAPTSASGERLCAPGLSRLVDGLEFLSVHSFAELAHRTGTFFVESALLRLVEHLVLALERLPDALVSLSDMLPLPLQGSPSPLQNALLPLVNLCSIHSTKRALCRFTGIFVPAPVVARISELMKSLWSRRIADYSTCQGKPGADEEAVSAFGSVGLLAQLHCSAPARLPVSAAPVPLPAPPESPRRVRRRPSTWRWW